jgi:hypothetical protein
MVRGLPTEIQTPLRRRIVDDCTAIAAVSGGFLGLGHVSQAEHRVIDSIASELSRHEGTLEGGG